MSVITDFHQHSLRQGALLTDADLQSAFASILPSDVLPMELLAADPARLLASDSAVPVPPAFRPLLICLSSLHAIHIPNSPANNYGITAASAEEEGYASVQERDTHELQLLTDAQARLTADLNGPETLSMDMSRTEELCSALLVVKLAVTCSEAVAAASSAKAALQSAHEAVWMVVAMLSQSICLDIASRSASTADQERHLSTLVIAMLMPQLHKAVRTVVPDAPCMELVPKVCWMLCAVLTAPTAVASAVAHEIIRTGVSLHAVICLQFAIRFSVMFESRICYNRSIFVHSHLYCLQFAVGFGLCLGLEFVITCVSLYTVTCTVCYLL